VTLNLSEALAVAEELLALQPDDPSTRLSAAFFRLLVGQDATASSAIAEEFLAAEPDSLDIRRVAALGRLRTGQAVAGLDILPDDQGEARWQALHVALLRASGNHDDADVLASSIDPQALHPEERDLLKK